MKTSDTWKFRSIMHKIMMGFVLAAMGCSIAVIPAFCEEGHGHKGEYDRGRSEYRGHGHDHHHYVHGKRGYYAPPPVVYAPPPVVYAPPPQPGISIFLPIRW